MVIGGVYFMFFIYGGMTCLVLDIIAVLIRRKRPENAFVKIMSDPRQGLRIIFVIICEYK